jgi:chromatin remodeling complex protein RSC6
MQVLEVGLKKGAFLSSASCTPRKRLQEGGDDVVPVPGKKTTAKKTAFKVKEEEPVTTGVEKQPETGTTSEEKAVETTKRREIAVTPKRLLEPLASICKAKRLTRKAALKAVWAYIKAKKLLDPKDKTRIICDERLRKLTKTKVIASKALCGLLKGFMVPIKA